MSVSKHAKSRSPKGAFDSQFRYPIHDAFLQDLDDLLEVNVKAPLQGLHPEVSKFKIQWLRENLLSKFVGESTATADERSLAAIEKWQSMERRNERSNIRIYTADADFGPFTAEVLLDRARTIIEQIIGLSPPLTSVFGHGEFTNGASTRVKRSSTAIAEKYVGKQHVTREAWPYFRAFVLDVSPFWDQMLTSEGWFPEFVDGSVMFTVPKNSDIDRVACKEPEINMFMQRAVGNYLRAKLRKTGIDLLDQTKNRSLAMRASVTTRIATVDLSSASDLISNALVWNLLPLDWVHLLDDLRVKNTYIDGKRHELNMFSSMGNGFTFELESLIFLALTRACAYLTRTRGPISVYGDDIIVPSRCFGILSKVLQWCGLKVNTKKSFHRGFFRESCGGHYYAGVDVTPFYIRKPVRSLPDLILILNQYRKWATDEGAALQFGSESFAAFWFKWSRFVPSFLWGGRMDGADYALNTPGNPRKRLAEVLGKRKSNQLGGLAWWLHRRGEDDKVLETSFGTIPMHTTLRRNRTWEPELPLCQWWWEEIISPL